MPLLIARFTLLLAAPRADGGTGNPVILFVALFVADNYAATLGAHAPDVRRPFQRPIRTPFLRNSTPTTMHPERSSLAGPGAEPRHGAHVPRVLVISALALFLAGCISGGALSSVHSQLATAYGEATNQQLLLNLARLSNTEPAYFIQLGAFSEEYSTSAEASLSSAYVRNSGAAGSSGPQRTLTLGGGPKLSVSENPTFNFVPLTGDIFSRLLLRPLPPDTVREFMQSGFHLDVLFRMMIQSIEIETKASHPEKCNPPFGSTDKSDSQNCNCKPKLRDVLVNHPLDSSYPIFLELCYELNRAQRGALVRVKLAPDREAEGSFVVSDAKDAIEASKAAFQVQGVGNQFKVIPAEAKVFRLEAAEALPPSEYPILSVLTSGDYNVTYNFRSFEALMYAVAREEIYFRSLYGDTRQRDERPHDEYEVSASAVHFTEKSIIGSRGGPRFEVTITSDSDDGKLPRGMKYLVRRNDITIEAHPILTLTSYSKEPPAECTIAELLYEKKRYVVGSENDGSKYPTTRLPSMTNRNVFALISYLFGRAALEPNQLPIQQLIRVK